MRYRALFIGGPADGQERILVHCSSLIGVRDRPRCVYRLLFAFGEMHTLVYSLYGIEETMNRLWHRYSGEDQCPSFA